MKLEKMLRGQCQMRDWRQALQRWITYKDVIASLAQNKVEYYAWEIRVPSSGIWPALLPTCQAITDFYQICDGGNFNWFELPALSQISELNHFWFRMLSDYDKHGNVLVPKRHVVIAVDSGGAPVIWDAVTND